MLKKSFFHEKLKFQNFNYTVHKQIFFTSDLSFKVSLCIFSFYQKFKFDHWNATNSTISALFRFSQIRFRFALLRFETKGGDTLLDIDELGLRVQFLHYPKFSINII